jgi:ribosomal protein S8
MDLSAIKPGNKDEVHSINVNNEYLFAKSEISKIAEEQSKEMKKNLAKKLEIELDRIKLYYSNQIREKDEEIERCTKKIKLFESELKHTFYDRDISNIKRKIREQTQILEKLKQQGYLERLKNEETFHINDEIDKHVLSLSHYLLHTMVIYYPALTLELALQGKKSSSSLKIQVTYDPLLKKFAIPACSSCSKEIDEINICQQNHLVCENCLKKCSCCGRD